MTTPRANSTKTNIYWMVRTFREGRWDCDVGQYFDREDAEAAIKKRPATEPGVEKVAVRITETILSEYDAA